MTHINALQQIWTIVQNHEGDSMPWVGVFTSEEACKEAIDEWYAVVYGEDEAPMVSWGDYQEYDEYTGGGVLIGIEGDEIEYTQSWTLVRHYIKGFA